MEENILKILLSHIEAVTEKNSPFVPTAINGVPQSAKEIASHFREFIEWCIINTYKPYNTTWFGVCDIDRTFNTIDELYNYWIKEVKK